MVKFKSQEENLTRVLSTVEKDQFNLRTEKEKSKFFDGDRTRIYEDNLALWQRSQEIASENNVLKQKSAEDARKISNLQFQLSREQNQVSRLSNELAGIKSGLLLVVKTVLSNNCFRFPCSSCAPIST